MRKRTPAVAAMLLPLLAGCGPEAPRTTPGQAAPQGTSVAVVDSTVPDVFEASGTATPVRAATVSTKLMGTVTAVLVREGDAVTEGQSMVMLDARDLVARRSQVEAGLAAALAMQADAAAHAGRIRGLYADSAATAAQLDQAEAALARADAAVTTARAAATELAATASYADVRAPFAGTVTRRFVDAGAFASPGAPLVTVEDVSTLRVSVSAPPAAVRDLRRGRVLVATIGDSSTSATIEGAVPAGANLYTVNALVPNAGGAFLSGSAATLALPRGSRTALLVPAQAVLHQGDLTGVRVSSAGSATLRWVRVGQPHGSLVEVLSGLAVGDSVLVPGDSR